MRVLLFLLILHSPALAQVIGYSALVRPAILGAPTSTVAALPACNAATTGQVYTVTDALTPTVLVAVVGGGAVTLVVHCNGTSWLVG